MAKHRTHSIEFKRQVVQDYLGGETLYGLAIRHEISPESVESRMGAVARPSPRELSPNGLETYPIILTAGCSS